MSALGGKTQDLAAAFSRLSRREKIMVGGLAVCFVLFVGMLLSLWISSRLAALQRRIDDSNDKLQAMIDMRAEFETAKAARKKAEQRIRAARHIQLMGTLENLAKQLGIDTQQMEMNPRPTAGNPETNVEEERVDVKIPRITIDRLVDFLAQLEKRSASIAVRTLHIKNNFREPQYLDVSFTVSKFQLKEKEASPGAAAGRGKKS